MEEVPGASDSCSKCGEPLSAGARFCRGCGAPRAEATDRELSSTEGEKAQPRPAVPCPGCGQENPPGRKFCRGCGAELSKSSRAKAADPAVAAAARRPLQPPPSVAAGDRPAPEWRRWAPAAAVAGLLVAGVVVALLLSGRGSSDRDGTAAMAPTSTDVSSGTETPGTATELSTTSTSASPQADRAAIIEVLRGYENAYSNASLVDMSKLLTPDVERHGLSAGGCSTVSGKSSVLSAYRSQFAQNGPVPYRLVRLSPRDVLLYGDGQARFKTEYSISSTGNSGSISFTLGEGGGGWSISGIDATCSPSSS
jgi:zinc-ribbon domain